MLQSQRQPPKLLEQVRAALRTRHYSLRTEETYLSWIKRFILFHGKRHPRDMGVHEVHQFLSHLAVEGQVAASTQSQALSAILFLYQQVLQQDIGWLHDVVRAKHPQRLPVVLNQDEVAKVLRQLSGVPWIMGTLLYGSGLRLLECLRLRVKDLDFAYNQIVVRDGKGRKIASPCCRSPSKPLYSSISRASNNCTRVIWRQAMGPSISPTLWRVNIPMPIATGYGNTCFLPPGSHATRALASSGGIIPTNRCSNGLCMALYARQASRNPPRATPFGTLRHNATPH
jgi:hypothetical protein